MVDRKALLDRIRAYQFALIDLGLYQDPRPDDEQAQKLRMVYRDKLAQLVDRYEQSYGPLVQTQEDVTDSWAEWIRDPWPWDNWKGGQ